MRLKRKLVAEVAALHTELYGTRKESDDDRLARIRHAWRFEEVDGDLAQDLRWLLHLVDRGR